MSQPAVSEVLAGNGIGISVLVAMCSAEGFSADEVLGLRPPSAPTERPARRLRDLPTWPAAAERARLAVDELDAPLVDEVGGFVPPAPIERVTVALVTALVVAWTTRGRHAPSVSAPRADPRSISRHVA